MSAMTEMVEKGLDHFFASPSQPADPVRRFDRQTLARCIHQATGMLPSLRYVSLALQEYVQAQGRRATTCTYRLGCRGYARSALWYVHDGPGLDPLVGESMILAHMEWLTRDLGTRAARDAAWELIPAAATHPTITAIVDATAQAIEQALVQMVTRARAEADFYQAVTGRLVEVTPPLTATEAHVLANVA